MARLQLRRGEHANLPTSNMLAGEPMVTTDRGTVFVATDATTKLPVVPAVDELVTLATLSPTDLILVHDVDETTGQMEKKVTFSSFKSALNIPEGSGDEMVAVVAGGEAGYIWGTDGTDGVLRMGTSMSWEKDSASDFVTFDVEVVDGGTF